MSVNEKMTALADSIREKSGVTGKLTIDGMTSAVKAISSLIVASASGNPIVLNDSTDLRVQSLRLFGKTTQDGIPTPEAPVPLVSAGDGGSLGVTVAGKNLLPNIFAGSTQTLRGVEFNIDTDGKITASGTASDYADLYLYGSISNNGNYLRIPKGCKVVTYGSALDNTNTLWLFREKTKGAITTINAVNDVLSVQDCYFYGVAFRVAKSATVDNFVSYAGIYAQSSDVIYEPYTAQTLSVSTPNGLPGIPVTSGGNYTDETGQQWVCDEVDFGRGVYVKRVFTNVFSDASGWILSGAASGAKRFGYKAYSSVIKGSSTQGAKANILCSSFPITSAEGTWNKIEGICADTGGIVYVYYGDIEQTLQGWGNYLASNPVTFMAVLATPIETALSAEELSAYAALHTNYPNTTILNDGGAGMEVKYVADTKLYIDNKINAMAAAIVNA